MSDPGLPVSRTLSSESVTVPQCGDDSEAGVRVAGRARTVSTAGLGLVEFQPEAEDSG